MPRVVSTAMRCFHEIQNEVSIRCPIDGPAEYRRTYIYPLIDQTRDIVVDKCEILPTYEHYFVSVAPPGETRRNTAAVLVAFVVARWTYVAR